MNCERFQMVADDLARNEKSDFPSGSPGGLMVMDMNERAGALAHVAECDPCAQALTAQNELSESLQVLAKQMNSLQAPSHLEAQLLAAHRGLNQIRLRQPGRRYWITAAAAVLLAVLGLMVLRWQIASVPQLAVMKSNSGTQTPGRQKPPASLLVPAGVNQAGKQASSAGSGLATNQGPKRGGRRSLRASRNFAAAQLARRMKSEPAIAEQANALIAITELTEVATDFVTVGYGSAVDLQEGGQMVRVELPRLALASFGLPVSMDRVDERVKADVLVGADGLAKAIRFVK